MKAVPVYHKEALLRLQEGFFCFHQRDFLSALLFAGQLQPVPFQQQIHPADTVRMDFTADFSVALPFCNRAVACLTENRYYFTDAIKRARQAVIISASRRTDIPAFYADWFMSRVRAGYFYRVNPFNCRQVSGFSLKPELLDAICFWTKNPRPLLPHLAELDERGLNYYFQFTLNAYDRTFEPNLPPLPERIETMMALAGRIGPERVVWRYDPVILSSVTPTDWHLEQAGRIADRLKDATRRLMFSFCDFYGKKEGRLSKALQGAGIRLADITAPEHRDALEQVAWGFKEIAAGNGLQIFSCSEAVNLAAIGIEHGACIDSALIRKLFGVDTSARKDKNQRTACNCVESADMGSYNSCPFGCSYCYANFNEGMIENNSRRHFPASPALLGRYEEPVEIRTSLHKKKKSVGCSQTSFDYKQT